MEEKTKGIVLKLTDYKDADKLASIFTVDYGVVTAKFVGVKRDKAKMKAMAQPFAMSEFVFNKKGDFLIVTSADLLDNFPKLLQDYNKTICGYILLDIIQTILPKEKVEKNIYLLVVSSLKQMEEKNEFVVLIDFILKFCLFQGVEVMFADSDFVYLNRYGDFMPNREELSMAIDKKIYTALKSLSLGESVDLDINTSKKILRLLNHILELKFDAKIKTFEFL